MWGRDTRKRRKEEDETSDSSGSDGDNESEARSQEIEIDGREQGPLPGSSGDVLNIQDRERYS